MKIFFIGGRGANRVKERFNQGGPKVICQLEIYLHAKSRPSGMKNEGVRTVLVGVRGQIGLRKGFIKGAFRVNHGSD